MIDFPDSTACNTLLPKKTFYEKLSFTAAQKNLFVHEIEKIIWRNKLSASTLNLQPGKRVTELQVFEVVLKEVDLLSGFEAARQGDSISSAVSAALW